MNYNFSVGIPTYNQAQYLKKAVLSVYNQSVKPTEIVVYDDCSTDNTAQVLDELSQEIEVLKVVRQDKNKGIAINKEACLKACKGDYIILLDSDDILDYKYAETLINLLTQFPEAGYAHGNVQQIDQKGNKTVVRKLYRKQTYLTANEELKRQIDGMKVAANIIMYRKKALIAIDYFNCTANFAEDWYMLCQLAAAGFGNVFTDKIISSYRVWSDQGQMRQKRKVDEIYGVSLVYDEVLIPAFSERNWDIRPLRKAKSKIAINHSDCLSVAYFSVEEKKVLQIALLRLSNTNFNKLVYFLQNHKTYVIFKYYKQLKNSSKNKIKFLLSLKMKNKHE